MKKAAKKKKNTSQVFLPTHRQVGKIQDVRQMIVNAMRKKKLTPYGLAKLSGVTEQAIYQYVKGKTDMRSERLSILLSVLGFEIRVKE